MRITLSLGNRIRVLIGLGLVALAVVSAFALMMERKTMLEDRQLKTRHLVEVAHGVVGHFSQLAQSGKLEEKQAQEMAKEALANLRYESNDYFWINDMGPRMVMHPLKPELNGKDLSGYKDPDGRQLFIDMAEIVKTNGAGFVAYKWPKPGREEAAPKISYVKGFPAWGWVIGSGIYVDDVNDAFRHHLGMFGIGIGILALVLIGASWRVSRSITGPLAALGATMTEVAASGNLRLAAPVPDKHEMGRIAEAFNALIASFAGTVRLAAASARSVASASQQLAGAAGQIKVGGGAQSEAAAATAAAVEEMSASIRQASENTDDAAARSCDAAALASQGATAVRRAGDGMYEIAQTVTQAAETVASLGTRSQQISAIVDVIKEIADQTNLLALNAAIEAARAGEHGRGFAVVADEVRKLSERTASSTKEIHSMIQGIQQETGGALTSMQAVNHQVQEGVARAQKAAATLESIDAEARRVEAMVQDISAGAREQSAAAGEIAGHIERIARMAEENASAVVQASAAACDLADLAEKLSADIGRFTV